MAEQRVTLVDANVLIDLALEDPEWADWSATALERVRDVGAVAVNAIICAELAPAYATAAALETSLPPDEFLRLDLPFEAAWLAGQAFVRHRRAGGLSRSPLPDFYIGAHAQASGLTLLTRDAPRYRTYFPEVELIAPDA